MWHLAIETNRVWRRVSTAIVGALLLAGVLLNSAPVAAQNSCGPRDALVAALGSQYDESAVAIGLAGGGGVIEVLATRDGGTWTIVLTTPEGLSCIVTSGEAWIDIVRQAKGRTS